MALRDSVYRERFGLTLEDKPVDRCPIDLGGTPQSTIQDPQAAANMARYLGIAGAAPDDYDKLDRRLLEHWDVDFRRAGTLLGYETAWRRRVSDTEWIDEYGIHHVFGGRYWELGEGPLRGATRDELAAYEFPGPEQVPRGVIDDCAARARQLCEQTPYVVVGEHPVFGVLELACWLCGYDCVMEWMAADPESVHLLFGKILAFQKRIIPLYYGALGGCIHLTTSGDDFGTQHGLFMSPAMWREFVKPYMRERIAFTAQFTDAVYMHHSCGAVFDIIPDLIDTGVRILNPIQPAAAGMAPERLKAAYGRSIVFHGGLDTQAVLPSGDASRISGAVRALIDTMRPRTEGGYIFAPAHNLQADVSSASIAAMYDAACAAGR